MSLPGAATTSAIVLSRIGAESSKSLCCEIALIPFEYPKGSTRSRLNELLAAAKKHGLEGIIAKRIDSPYQAGERSSTWVKYKTNLGQELVIGGYIPGKVHVLSEKDQDVQKRDYLIDFKTMNVVVFGNGNNDRLLLQAVKTGGGLCIAVQNGEGCAADALINSHLLAATPAEALDLLLNPDTLAATLRY